MPLARHYSDQARLLVTMLPHIARHDCFALKGGTALNFFVRDLPRLSVDIDLVYLPIADRGASLTAINQALAQIAVEVETALPGALVHAVMLKGTHQRIKLLVTQRGTSVKVEVSDVLRGSVFEPETREIGIGPQRLVGYARVRLLSFEDLYAGKLCAALDRQHPRDLFDMRVLLDNEGITPRVKDAFLVYLMSHDRPMAEILAPNWKDVSDVYEREFAGMTVEPVTLDTLLATRDQMLAQVRQQLTDADREFLISVKRGDPDWSRFPISHAQSLPAIRWKLYNLSQMSPTRRAQALASLQRALTHCNAAI